MEVYADMIQIVDDAGYVPTDWTDQPNALNLWGPEMPADLLEFGLPVLESVVPSTAATRLTSGAALPCEPAAIRPKSAPGPAR